MWGWALQDVVGLGTPGTLCGWTLQKYCAAGHCTYTAKSKNPTVRMGNQQWQPESVAKASQMLGGFVLCEADLAMRRVSQSLQKIA